MYDQTPPAYHPDDAVRATMSELMGSGQHVHRDTWQIVIMKIEGRWQPALLTTWRRLPSGWVAHLRWREDRGTDPGWGWFQHDPERIQPLTVAGMDAVGLGAPEQEPSE